MFLASHAYQIPYFLQEKYIKECPRGKNSEECPQEKNSKECLQKNSKECPQEKNSKECPQEKKSDISYLKTSRAFYVVIHSGKSDAVG